MYRLLIVFVFVLPLVYTDEPTIMAEEEVGYELLNTTDEEICVTCTCWVRMEDRAMQINCSARNLTELPALKNKWQVTLLDLSKNQLKKEPNLTDSSYSSLRVLMLNENQIKNVTEQLISPNLTELYLDHNKLAHINNSVLLKLENATNIVKITLHGNRWSCFCHYDILQLADFLRRGVKEVPKLSEIECRHSVLLLKDLTDNIVCYDQVKLLVCLGSIVLFLIIARAGVNYWRNDYYDGSHEHINQVELGELPPRALAYAACNGTAIRMN